MKIQVLKALLSIIFLFALLTNCLSQVFKNYKIPDSLIKDFLQSAYPAKKDFRSKIEEIPSIIYSKAYWVIENNKPLILNVKGFDSLTIKNQLQEREIIYVDSIMHRKMSSANTTDKVGRNILYILFSKDLNEVIVREQRYCGEDCGSDFIILYKKSRKGDWGLIRVIFGGSY
jgi:hypothetical protein